MAKTKLWAGVALCGQSAILLTSSLTAWKKESGLAKTYFVLSAASGIAGAFLLKEHCKEKQIALEKQFESDSECYECTCEDAEIADSENQATAPEETE